MGSKIRFTPQAQGDLHQIKEWIAQDNSGAADRVVSRIRQTVMMFGQFPKLGHEGAVAETREFKVTGLPYLIVYAIAPDADIDILTIIHSKRQYPPET